MRSEDLHKWLDSEIGRRFLEKISRRVYRYAAVHRLPLEFIQFRHIGPDGADRAAAEIRSELVFFILSSDAARSILADSADVNMENRLRWAFIHFLTDRVRRRGVDAWRYLRKKAVKDLPAYFQKPPGKLHLMRRSLSDQSRALVIGNGCPENENERLTPVCLTPDELQEIPFPSDSLIASDFKTVSKAKNLAFLAEYFFHAVSGIWPSPLCFELNDWIDWIFLYVRPEPEGSHLFPKPEEVLRPAPPEGGEPDERRIHAWAEVFSRRMSRRMKIIFLNRYCLEKKLEPSAAAAGFTSPASASYQMNRFREMLQDYLQELPAPPSDAAEKEACELFLFFLCEILKKSNPATYQT